MTELHTPRSGGAGDSDGAAPVLEARGLTSGYFEHAAVKDVDMFVGRGEVVSLLGANGAGKTTLIKAIVGQLPAWKGSVLVARNSSSPTYRRVRGGLGWFPDSGQCLWASLSQNLKLGRGAVSDALDAFPELEPLLSMKAGVLSGGQQQILAVARVLAAKPRIILADELSVGLAPDCGSAVGSAQSGGRRWGGGANR